MNEDSARAVTLLQAFETAQPPTPNWGDEDRAWATRLALQDAPGNAPDFIVRRAHHALQRLGPREPAATRWLARPLWHWRWVGINAAVPGAATARTLFATARTRFPASPGIAELSPEWQKAIQPTPSPTATPAPTPTWPK